MTMRGRILRSLPLATVVLAGAAPVALAQWNRQGQGPRQGQMLFEWSGSVDREKQITMRGDRVWTNNVGRTEPRRDQARAMSTIPRQDGQVFVRLVDGRGDVEVIQQPTARNGYSTIIRVLDPRSGSDNYRLAAYWQGNGNSNVYGRDRDEPRHRDRDNDDRNGGYGQNGQNGQYGQYGNQSMMHWSGNVDDELEIRIQNGRAEYRTIRGAQPTSIRATSGTASMPRSNAQLTIAQNQGRGSVTIVQQPSSWNGNTTVIRVKDQQGGYGYYDFDLMWQ